MKHLAAVIPICLFTIAVRAGELPTGKWVHEDSSLSVVVEAAPKKPDKETGIVVGKRFLSVTAPPLRGGRADDIFLISSQKVAGTTVTLGGIFNWDTGHKAVEIVVRWKDGTPELEITKNAGYARFAAGKYVLKKAAK